MENNWEAGDIAICKIVGNIPGCNQAGDPPPLRLNVEYVVHIARQCECGTWSLDVGLSSKGTAGTRCICGAVARPGTGIHWANASRFVKKKTREAIQEEIDEAIHDENYELAEQLRQKL